MNTEIIVSPSETNLANLDTKELTRLKQYAITSIKGPRGRVLTEGEAAQMALLSLSTGFSFLTGELYFTDTGPQIGVVGYERKAQEYLDAIHPGVSVHYRYRPAEPKLDADFDPSRGDIGYVCILTRDDWDAEWQASFSKYLKMMTEAGIKGQEAVEQAKALAGPKRTVEYAGVVDGREKFSGVYRGGDHEGEQMPEMMDRHERARKRARKGAIKHAFPRLDIPDPLKILARSAAQRIVQETVEILPPDNGESKEELLEGLGYDVPLAPPDIEEEIIEVEPEKDKPVPQAWKGKIVQKMIKEYGYSHANHAVNALNQSHVLTGNSPDEHFTLWLEARANGKSKGVKDASAFADNALADAIAQQEQK